jgi:5-methylcytosine-specific restriction endonuclease McrA
MSKPKLVPKELYFQCVVRENGICQRCKEPLLTDNIPLAKRLEVHHINPLKNGGDHSLSNLMLLCHDCHMREHGRKTNVEDTSLSYSNIHKTPDYEDSMDNVIPAGSLVYVPAPRPTSKREKKGVSG